MARVQQQFSPQTRVLGLVAEGGGACSTSEDSMALSLAAGNRLFGVEDELQLKARRAFDAAAE